MLAAMATPPDTQWEIVEHIIPLGARVPLTPMRLPMGWVPLMAVRGTNRAVVLMVRDVTGVVPSPASWPYELLAATGPPSSEGEASLGSADQANPVSVWVAVVDGAGVDHSADFGALVEGSVLHMADAGNVDVWQEYMCRAAPAVVGGVVTFDDPIHWNSGGVLSVPSAVTVTLLPPQTARAQAAR